MQHFGHCSLCSLTTGCTGSCRHYAPNGQYPTPPTRRDTSFDNALLDVLIKLYNVFAPQPETANRSLVTNPVTAPVNVFVTGGTLDSSSFQIVYTPPIVVNIASGDNVITHNFGPYSMIDHVLFYPQNLYYNGNLCTWDFCTQNTVTAADDTTVTVTGGGPVSGPGKVVVFGHLVIS